MNCAMLKYYPFHIPSFLFNSLADACVCYIIEVMTYSLGFWPHIFFCTVVTQWWTSYGYLSDSDRMSNNRIEYVHWVAPQCTMLN